MKTHLLPIVLLCPLLGLAQIQSYTGRIEGPAGEPAAYATVILMRDGAQTAGTTTDSLGVFALQVRPGTYTACVRHLSYRPLELTFTAARNNGSLGVFRLQEAVSAAQTVVVEASSVTRRSDRFVVTVGDTPAFAGKDGAELVAQAPGIWLDDEGIAINGMKGVKVFVDDREIHLDGDRITAYLRSLPASEIARIEVIPQAGAEYGADARGGVLRIFLRRRRADGMNGSLAMSVSQGAQLSNYRPSGNAAVHAGKWTLNAAVSGIFTPRGQAHYDEWRTYSADAGRFSGRSDLDDRINYGSGRLGLFCDIAPHHTLGGEAEYASERHRVPSTARTLIAQSGSETAAASRYRQNGTGNTLSAAFNYRWQIDTLGSALKILFDYTRRGISGDNGYGTRFTAGGLHRDTAYRSRTASRLDIFSAEADLDRRLARRLMLKAGLKYTRNHLDDDARYEGLTSQGWVSRDANGYALAYTEQITAAYASLEAEAGPWSFSAGLRGEYTATEGRGSEVHKSYFGLFPHASATWSINRIRTWMLSAQYSRNIERPGFRALNPARIQFSDYNYQIGNPALRPAYIHRVSLTLIWKYRYTLSVGGNLHRDLIREICRNDPQEPDVTYITPANHHTENHWFVAVSAPLKLLRSWTLTVNFVGVRQDIRMTAQEPSSGHWLMFANAVTGIDLPAKFHLELDYSGHSRLFSGNSEVEARHVLGASVKKRLCGGRLIFSVAVENIFDSREAYVSRTEGLVRRMQGRSAWSARRCKLSLTWNFRTGREFKARRIEGAADPERSRMGSNNGQSK